MRYNVSYTLHSGKRGFMSIETDSKNNEHIKKKVEEVVKEEVIIKYIKKAQ